MRSLKRRVCYNFLPAQGFGEEKNCWLCTETKEQPHKVTDNHKCAKIHKISVRSF